MSYEFLLVENKNQVATVTINRPKALNALNSGVLKELAIAFAALEGDENVRVVVLTGSGEKAFVAGADIKEMSTMNSKEAFDFSRLGLAIIEQVNRMQKPVIAAVNGFSLGGGFEVALACDFIYASDNAKFGFPEVTLGVIPGLGGTQTLSRVVSPAVAKELIFSGRIIGAEEAKSFGMVNAVLPQTELLEKVQDLGEKIAKNGGQAVALAKDAIFTGLNMAKEDAVRYEGGLFGALFSTKDQKEGMQAFVEKRKAQFKNR